MSEKLPFKIALNFGERFVRYDEFIVIKEISAVRVINTTPLMIRPGFVVDDE